MSRDPPMVGGRLIGTDKRCVIMWKFNATIYDCRFDDRYSGCGRHELVTTANSPKVSVIFSSPPPPPAIYSQTVGHLFIFIMFLHSTLFGIRRT